MLAFGFGTAEQSKSPVLAYVEYGSLPVLVAGGSRVNSMQAPDLLFKIK